MLRCPPSRIELTSNDISTFKRQMADRQLCRLRQPGTSNVRLNAGPARSTSLSLVPAEQNIGRRRAVSSSSEATMHEMDYGSLGGVALTMNRPNQGRQGGEAMHSALDKSRSRPSPRRQVDSYYGTGVPDSTCSSSLTTARSLAGLDGFTESGIPHSPTQVTCNLVFQTAQATHTDLSTTGAPIKHEPTSGPQLLSSARTRRRHRREGHEMTTTDSALGNSFDQADLAHHSTQTIPDIVLPSIDVDISPDPALNPGAPVFIPRTRFGTTSSSSADGLNAPRWSSVDTTHSAIDLRIRSSSERNSNVFGGRLPHQGPSDVSPAILPINSDLENNLRRPRQRSRTTDQNASFIGTANLERYPLFRPEYTLEPRYWDSRLSPSTATTSNARVVSPSTLRNGSTTSLRLASSDFTRVQSEVPLVDKGRHLRSATPAMLRDTRSTPDLTKHEISPGRIYCRGSSLSWSRSASGISNMNRVPNNEEAASGFSIVDRANNRDGLDAATEFLRMRSSPLDDLTERLSKLSTSRASSLDKSFDSSTTSQRKVSLLAGDPFRADAHIHRRDIGKTPLHRTHPLAICKDDPQPTTSSDDTTLEDLVALSLALPPSSSLPSTPQVRKYSSPHEHSSPQPPERRTAMRDITSRFPSSPPSAIKRKPVPTCKTPKVTVYDDSKPPHTQPQTHEDIARSERRNKARSDTTCADSPLGSRRVKPNSPPIMPERHSHRHTYPSIYHGQSSPDITSGTPGRALGTTHASPIVQTAGNTRPGQASRSGLEHENELQGHLSEMEDDRRIWIDRQEAGPLDATPPKESRYERYLV